MLIAPLTYPPPQVLVQLQEHVVRDTEMPDLVKANILMHLAAACAPLAPVPGALTYAVHRPYEASSSRRPRDANPKP